MAFLHLDPTLEESIGYSVESLIGTSVLDFIHPNEAMKIEYIILQYAQEKGNTGKMIRCTMKSVLSMGKYVHSTQKDRELDLSNFAHSIESDHQLTDIRLELIGDEMLLCFFHAVENRNDQSGNTQMSNLCDKSLNTFDDDHCQSLWQHILSKRFIEPSSSTIERHQSGFPIKVFQILTNYPFTNILFSWPPPRLFDSLSHQSTKSDTESYQDGSYFADTFARSTFETNFKEEAESSSLSQLMTACTRKELKAMTINTDGLLIEFEAMVIPCGEIKFAIFSISKAEKVDQIPKDEHRQLEQQQQQQPQLNPFEFRQNQQSIQPMEQGRQTFYSQPTFPITTIPSFQSMPVATGNPFISQAPQMFYNLPTARMIDNADLSEYGRRASADVYPTTIHHHFPSVINNTTTNNNNNNTTFYQSQPIRTRNEQSQISSTSSFPLRPRSFSILESSLKKCLTCGTSKSPEWRKGPDGYKSLCNACGLRFSRNASRMKKKEEKARNAAEVAANGGIIPIHLRKKFQAEKDKKRMALQKNSQQGQEQSQQPQQQISDQMDMAEMSSFANISPELDIQIPSSILTSSSDVNNPISPIGNLISDFEMNIDDEGVNQTTSNLNYYQ